MANTFVSLRRLQKFYNGLKNKFALKSEVPSKTSDLTNDSGFLTSHQDISGKVDKNQGVSNADKYLAIGDDGFVEPKDGLTIYSDGNGNVEFISGVGISHEISEYNLPIANESTLGGVKPVDKTENMILPVGVDQVGKLWVGGLRYSDDGSGNLTLEESPSIVEHLYYTLSISENVITINGSDGSSSSVDLPIYDGGLV